MMCLYCGDVEETILHVLRDCPLAKDIWLSVIPLHDRGVFFMGELKTWMSFNLNNSVCWNATVDWCDFWALVCHCLWTWRNKEQHIDSFVRPYRPVQYIMKLVDDYVHATNTISAVIERNRMISMIAWVPPKATFVKLNTDGAYKDNQTAGCGGVIRGTQGEWLGGFAKHVGLCSAFMAELWGVYEGLRYASRMGFTKVELNIDSEAVVQVIKARRVRNSSGNTLVKQIRRLLDMNWLVEIAHTYREANKCADALANIGCSLDYDIMFFDSCPSQISEICEKDRVGNTTPRLVLV
ncbi:TMV resistance protein N [Trifolium repens]|nr:TMV resistance protein N [Trifolium repens]